MGAVAFVGMIWNVNSANNNNTNSNNNNNSLSEPFQVELSRKANGKKGSEEKRRGSWGRFYFYLMSKSDNS